MAPEVFHLFTSLPPELRQEIYKLATVPRIVHVQECSEDREKFRSRFAGQLSPPNLDPSLAHFAFNWRLRIPFIVGRQICLEDFGFRGPRKAYPWIPSPATPEISLHWLSDHEDIAWELTRKAELYSRAPIPALLHTCSESRSTLIRWGYTLAFGTRSEEPKTWFKFDADVLYLKECALAHQYDVPIPSMLLSGGCWDVGQFLPRDLRKVRRLALENAASCMDGHNLRASNTQSKVLELGNLVRLFSHLNFVLLVDWNSRTPGYSIPTTESQGDFNFNYESDDEYSTPRSYEEPQLWWYSKPEPMIYEQPELWGFVAVEEIDALISLFFPQLMRPRYICAAGKHGSAIKAYKNHHDNSVETSFWRIKEAAVEKRLLKERNALLETNASEETTSWQIPILKAVHVMQQSQLVKLKGDRRQVLERIVQERAEISTDADEQLLLARWLSIWAADDAIFTPTKDEEDWIERVVEEDKILARRDFENAEIDNLQQKWFARRNLVVDEYDIEWAEDEKAYQHRDDQYNYYDQWSPLIPNSDDYDFPDPDDVQWWIRKGWFPMLNNPSLELRAEQPIGALTDI